jgi:hypothetical protein
MESILFVDIPVQMISCTDTNGKITPLRFRFRDRDNELVTINIEQILSDNQKQSRVGITFTCAATLYGTQKQFVLNYSFYSHEWRLSQLKV